MNRFCENCGNKLGENVRFCAKCGAPAGGNAAPPQATRPTPPTQGGYVPSQARPKPIQSGYAPAPQSYSAPAPAQPQYVPPPGVGRRRGIRTACIALAALLVVQIIAVILFGWPGFAVPKDDGEGAAQTLGNRDENSRPPESGGTRPGSAPPPTPTPTPASEIMRDSIAAMMARMSDEGLRGGVDAGALFGLPSDMYSYKQAELSVSVTPPGDSGEAITYSQRDVIAEDGGGEHSMRLDMGGESLDGGAWFESENMIIRFGDASKPMIRYGLSGNDAKAMAGLIPMDRYQLCLRADSPSAAINTDWNAALGDVGELLLAHEDDISESESALDAANETIDVRIQELTLTGDEALAAFGSFIGAWETDLRSGDVLRVADLTADKANQAAADATGGGSGSSEEAPDTLERMSALLEAQDAELTIKTGVSNDIPVHFELAFASSDGECGLKLLCADGDKPYSSVALRLPEGDGYDFENSSSANARTAKYTIFQPGGAVLGECVYTNAITESGSSFASEYSLELIDYGKEDVPEGERITSSGVYSHSAGGGAVESSFEGTFTRADAEPIGYTGTLRLSEAYGEIDIPEFIEGSGMEAASRRELFELLHSSGDEDATAEEIEESMAEFYATPMPLQAFTSNVMLLGGL